MNEKDIWLRGKGERKVVGHKFSLLYLPKKPKKRKEKEILACIYQLGFEFFIFIFLWQK